MGTLATLPDRIDFAVVTSGVVVTRFWLIGGRNGAPHAPEVKPAGFHLEGGLARREQNGHTVRRGQGGARGRGGVPRALRTPAPVWRRGAPGGRLAMRGGAGGCTLSRDFALDG